ncbi:hypothetical protein QH494_02480 [Sphingomonas sp. AR_OL41]|uniref:hypothetical protein n=1 Tax=Sphingomonas sp. AR_OL41 TaxID=3042729 RepID=UPI0024815114|nr:hypothetical protein [Sphingomonas sp. AR_OL41]MDH7971035.1 hypothetical protein [Sphingomonas sp. AR_OL41]
MAFTGTKPTSFTTKSIYQTGTRSERYVRLDFSAPSHPDGFIQAQRIVIGKSILSPGVDYTAEHTLIDPTSISSTLGIDIIDAIALARPRWKFSMSYVDAGSWRNDWVNLLASCGKVWPLLMVVDTTTPSTWQTDSVFGRIRNDATAKAIGYTIRTIDLTIDALAP